MVSMQSTAVRCYTNKAWLIIFIAWMQRLNLNFIALLILQRQTESLHGAPEEDAFTHANTDLMFTLKRGRVRAVKEVQVYHLNKQNETGLDLIWINRQSKGGEAIKKHRHDVF